VALNLACRRPERLLTLTAISAHAGLDEAERSVRLMGDLALADRIQQQGVDWFARYWAEQPLFRGLARRGPEFLAGLDSSRRRNDAGQLAGILRGLGAGATPPFWDRLDTIHVPTLLVAGAEDERYAGFAGRLHRAIPGSRVAIVPDAGHPVHLEQPGAVARLLRDHLSTR
jgi:pimeloyl-ACP methyl ester carboxylesterase